MELIIQNGSNIFYPVVEEGITWETARKGVPGKLTFTVVKDGSLNFQEGNAVRLNFGGKNVFYGFIFTKKRDKGNTINVIAYDQLRYLKNKDTYVYTNKTASDFIKMIAADFRLNTGTIENTPYKIASRVEDNKTLFDMIQNALDLTLENKKQLYVLYDDFGKLTLKNIESMKLDLLLDEDTAENYDYTSSIDSNTYNKIKLSYENEKTGKREIYIAQDSNNMNNWGILQLFETIQEKTNGKVKADTLLALYNRKTRNLSVKDAFGDVRVRGGSSVVVKLSLGDVNVQNYMIVETAKHIFKNNEHFMDLKLRGGDFVA
ncbi:hydrolase [Paenibacillus lentus]|uniref:Hydrolase n=1 Tax=Paenibacillus lentus TaxID=1338368 RepID=A0A3S8S1Z4_9BACL|nr:hydrolase [Paenibacillus lentus]